MLMSACSTAQQNTQSKQQPSLGMANPASVYCAEQGGRLEIKDEANGQVGYCHLPNGQIIEEWALFRASQTECIAEKAKSLIGQKTLSEEKIKSITQAKTVRQVQPNQPVTMDYRAERVTVTVDPVTQQILQASCG